MLFESFGCFVDFEVRKEKKREKSKRKEEKREKSCFLICVFGLFEWLLFFFSFFPNTLSLSHQREDKEEKERKSGDCVLWQSSANVVIHSINSTVCCVFVKPKQHGHQALFHTDHMMEK